MPVSPLSRHSWWSLRRVPVAVAAAAALLAAAGAAVTPVAAAPAGPATSFDEAAQAYLVTEYQLTGEQAEAALDEQAESLRTAGSLERSLGSRVVRTVVEERTGELTVEVTDAEAASTVEAAGAEAVVDDDAADDAAELAAAQDQLEDRLAALGAAGVALSLGADGEELVLSVPAGPLDQATSELVTAATELDAAVHVERTAGAVETLALYGGEQILRAGVPCSAGVTLSDGTTPYLLTAGHCEGDGWTDDGVLVGTTTASSFPVDDYKLIRIDDPATVDPRGEVLFGSGRYDVSSAGSPPVGATVCRTGGTTGTWCGEIEAYDATVGYSQGQVDDLVRANVCAERGDSGGPLYAAGGVVVGVTSGGNGDCTAGGTTYYQPVVEVTNAFGLSVL